MAIDSKNKLVWVKAMARGQALPLDASEVWESKEAAEAYAAGIADSSSVAYVGQTLKVVDETNNATAVYIVKDTNGNLMQLADVDSVHDDRYYTETEIDSMIEPFVDANYVSTKIAEAIASIDLSSYVLDIDYNKYLAFDTSETLFGIGTSAALGRAVLGQMVLG